MTTTRGGGLIFLRLEGATFTVEITIHTILFTKLSTQPTIVAITSHYRHGLKNKFIIGKK